MFLWIAVFLILGTLVWSQIPPESDEIKELREKFGKAF